VWQRRQEMSSQQMTTGPALMEEVERTEVVIVHPQQRTEVVQRNPYAMDVDKRRNCYACEGFGHMARNYKNRGMGMNR